MSTMLAAAAAAVFFLARGLSVSSQAAPGRPARPPAENVRRLSRAVVTLSVRVLPDRLKELATADLLVRSVDSGYEPEELLAVRLTLMIAAPLAAVTLFRFSLTGIVLVPALSTVGFIVPRAVASRGRARYLESLKPGVTQMCDMLYAFVLGGKNLDQAFRDAAEATAEPLGSLLVRAAREVELGSAREEAFAHLQMRCPLPELATLLRTLGEAERRGFPLSSTLGTLSREIRLKERDDMRVAVAKAPLKMLAPLVLLILPASVLLTVGPTLIATLGSIL